MKTNLSEYIRDDVRRRVLSATQVPERLTLPSLAEHYRVSIMPVRIAIQELLEERILIRQENGRLCVNPRKLGTQTSARASQPPAPPTEPYDVILKDVLADVLRGESRELKIVPCSEKYEISPSQVHAIFHRLASQGLLEHTPRRGWCVRPFKVSDLDAYLTVRESLEILALDLSRERLSAGRLEELLALNAPLTERGPGSIDNSLHRYWVETSENRYIMDFFVRHQLFYDMLLSHAVFKRSHIEDSRASHRRILEAMLSKDWPRARSELAKDIRHLSPLLKKTVERLEGRQQEN